MTLNLVRVASWRSHGKLYETLPNNTEICFTYSLVLFLRADLKLAFSEISKTLQLDPDNRNAKELRSRIKHVSAYKKEGKEFLNNGKWRSALVRFSDALEKIGLNEEEGFGGMIRAQLLCLRSEAYLKFNKLDEAHSDIRDSLKLGPSYSKAYIISARLYVQMEIYELAIKDFTRALELLGAGIDGQQKEDLEDELCNAKMFDKHVGVNYYKLLGLERGCSATEIKKAYHKSCLRYHPDKGGKDVELFKLVGKAYDVLSDPESRHKYDDRETKYTYSQSSAN